MNEHAAIEGPVSAQDFNPLDQKIQGCPYPYYKAMRSECPVFQAPQTGMFYVTKYDDIRHIKRHPELFTSDMVAGDRIDIRDATIEAGRILKSYGWEHVQTLQRTMVMIDQRTPSSPVNTTSDRKPAMGGPMALPMAPTNV